MYLHLGQDVVVRMSDVVGIFDMENTSTSRFTKEFLRQATHEMEVVTVSYEMPKSFVLCERDGKKTLYISQISPATLKKRATRVMEEGA